MTFFLTVVIENCEILKRENCFYKTHRALKALLSSPLAKSNNLRVVLHTSSNVMIEIDPLLDIPNDIEEYLEMMEYLSKRMKLKASNEKVLAKVIRSKINEHLNPNTFRIGLNPEGRLLEIGEIKENLAEDRKNSYTAFLNLGESKGCDVEFNVRVSNYELGVDYSLFRLLNKFEEALDIF